MVEAEAAFNKALSLDDPQNPGVHAIRVLAQMKQGLGDHWAAIRVLTKAIELNNNPERIQCLFLRGAGTLPDVCWCLPGYGYMSHGQQTFALQCLPTLFSGTNGLLRSTML